MKEIRIRYVLGIKPNSKVDQKAIKELFELNYNRPPKQDEYYPEWVKNIYFEIEPKKYKDLDKSIKIDHRVAFSDEDILNPVVIDIFNRNYNNTLKDMFKSYEYIDCIETQTSLHDYPSGKKLSIEHIPQFNMRAEELYNEEESNKRMDIIGRNGNTGEHYES